jgi:hypothetical protein
VCGSSWKASSCESLAAEASPTPEPAPAPAPYDAARATSIALWVTLTVGLPAICLGIYCWYVRGRAAHKYQKNSAKNAFSNAMTKLSDKYKHVTKNGSTPIPSNPVFESDFRNSGSKKPKGGFQKLFG